VNARLAFLIVTLALCAGSSNISFALDEAKIHVAGTPNITSFVYHVGKEKGFYREEGIELQPIMAGMLQGIQGLIGGSFDYSQMLGQGGGAIMRGAPLKIGKTACGLELRRRPRPDDPRASAQIWPGTDARCHPARHRAAA